MRDCVVVLSQQPFVVRFCSPPSVEATIVGSATLLLSYELSMSAAIESFIRDDSRKYRQQQNIRTNFTAVRPQITQLHFVDTFVHTQRETHKLVHTRSRKNARKLKPVLLDRTISSNQRIQYYGNEFFSTSCVCVLPLFLCVCASYYSVAVL